MALTIDEIREAALIGKSFTLTDIKLVDMSYDNGNLSLGWEMPQMQNKHYCPGMVVDYISICEKPKHDPCRPFREGDVVQFRKVNGNNARCRYNGIEIKEGSLGRIVGEEGRNCFWVKFDVNRNWCLDAAYFELVTPVEELEPYYLEESTGTITLLSKLDPLYHTCWHYADVESGIKALAIAEAERKRLNEEWRKEQK